MTVVGAEVEEAYRLWHDLTPNPTDFEVEAAFAAYMERVGMRCWR